MTESTRHRWWSKNLELFRDHELDAACKVAHVRTTGAGVEKAERLARHAHEHGWTAERLVNCFSQDAVARFVDAEYEREIPKELSRRYVRLLFDSPDRVWEDVHGDIAGDTPHLRAAGYAAAAESLDKIGKQLRRRGWKTEPRRGPHGDWDALHAWRRDHHVVVVVTYVLHRFAQERARDQLCRAWIDASFHARSLGVPADPLPVLGSARLTDRECRQLSAFAAQRLPTPCGIGFVDFDGLVYLTRGGEVLARCGHPGASGPPRRTSLRALRRLLRNDGPRLIVKKLLTPDLEGLISGPPYTPCSAGELAGRTGVARAAATQVINQLRHDAFLRAGRSEPLHPNAPLALVELLAETARPSPKMVVRLAADSSLWHDIVDCVARFGCEQGRWADHRACIAAETAAGVYLGEDRPRRICAYAETTSDATELVSELTAIPGVRRCERAGVPTRTELELAVAAADRPWSILDPVPDPRESLGVRGRKDVAPMTDVLQTWIDLATNRFGPSDGAETLAAKLKALLRERFAPVTSCAVGETGSGGRRPARRASRRPGA